MLLDKSMPELRALQTGKFYPLGKIAPVCLNVDKFGSGVHAVIETPCIQLLCVFFRKENRILCAMAFRVCDGRVDRESAS